MAYKWRRKHDWTAAGCLHSGHLGLQWLEGTCHVYRYNFVPIIDTHVGDWFDFLHNAHIIKSNVKGLGIVPTHIRMRPNLLTRSFLFSLKRRCATTSKSLKTFCLMPVLSQKKTWRLWTLEITVQCSKLAVSKSGSAAFPGIARWSRTNLNTAFSFGF